jgi:3-methylfumaryl-CoA hydratase
MSSTVTEDAVTEVSELLVPGPAEALGGLLGVPVPGLADGESLPLLWHWVYLLQRPAQSDLGPDGHPVRGSAPAPPGPGRRRMWAGGRVRALGPLRCGMRATKRTSVLSTAEKHGRSGRLTFVTLGHQILQQGQLVIDEQQDLVYREAASPATALATMPGDPAPADAGEWEIEVSPALLFRFSALTYNAHRIHYDREYARDAEGYPGLLTHGPLQALAMAEAAGAAARADVDDARGASFEYRLTSPLFDYQGMIVKAVRGLQGTLTSVRDRHGRQTATGTLRSADR